MNKIRFCKIGLVALPSNSGQHFSLHQLESVLDAFVRCRVTNNNIHRSQIVLSPSCF
ncbi:hypothetical protein ACROYT_G013737 [Oculina patagonica]